MTRRRIRSKQRSQMMVDDFTDSIIVSLKKRFPKANHWVIFSFVDAQREAGIGKDSERLSRLEVAWSSFRDDRQLPKGQDFDIIATSDLKELKYKLQDLYEHHELYNSRLCCMDDSDSELKVGYEYFWTE